MHIKLLFYRKNIWITIRTGNVEVLKWKLMQNICICTGGNLLLAAFSGFILVWIETLFFLTTIWWIHLKTSCGFLEKFYLFCHYILMFDTLLWPCTKIFSFVILLLYFTLTQILQPVKGDIFLVDVFTEVAISRWACFSFPG